MAIEAEGVRSVAAAIASNDLEQPSWRVAPHWWTDQEPEATARYVLLLDALNFSFWGEPKWRVSWNGQTHDGYYALALALRRAIESGVPLLDAQYLRQEADAAKLLAGDDGVEIPLLAERQRALNEVGAGLLDACDDSFLGCIEEAGGEVAPLVRLLAARFPSFRDVAVYAGRRVPLYKRAQILVSDLWGAFQGEGPGAFVDLDSLTMFADYKVPQVLHGLDVLRYSPRMSAALAAHESMEPNDPREVEIRAASICAVELIGAELARLGAARPAFEIDWALWYLGQGRQWPLPYHRTRTVAY